MIALYGIVIAASGFLLADLLVPFRRARMLKLGLCPGLGIALSSVVLFWSYVLFGNRPGPLFACDAAVLAILTALHRYLRERVSDAVYPDFTERGGAAVWAAFAVVSLSSVSAFALLSLDNPYGWADAIMLWNARARLLFESSGNAWRAIFSNRWVWHADYPLLLPGAIAHGWQWLGRAAPGVPIAVAASFLVATASLLMMALKALRGSLHAALAGTVLLGSPLYIYHAASQYADVPLAFFFLAALAAAAMAGRASPAAAVRLWALAGFACGCALWLKTEGALFVTAFAAAGSLAWLARRDARRWLRESTAFGLGIAPILGTLVYFKVRLSGPNYWTASGSAHPSLPAAATLKTYATVVPQFFDNLVNSGSLIVSGPLLLALYLVFAGVRITRNDRPALWMGSAVIAAMLAAQFYLAVVVTPWNLEQWHRRLLLQLWPSALFLFFLVAGSPHQSEREDAEAVCDSLNEPVPISER